MKSRFLYNLFLCSVLIVGGSIEAESYGVRCVKNFGAFLQRHIPKRYLLEVRDQAKRNPLAHQLWRWAQLDPLIKKESLDPRILSREQLQVRVLLAECTPAKSLVLDSPGGFIVSGLDASGNVLRVPEKIMMRCIGTRLSLNGRMAQSPVIIRPKNGLTLLDGQSYQGAMMVVLDKGQWLLINYVDLDDYLYSVLRWESWPGWPLEVNKAFAIACRSYVIAQIMSWMKAKNKRPYHIKNTNIHQTYKGVHTNHTLRDAVQKTQGVIMVHEQKPIMAMFDSCCGGVIPHHIEGVDFESSPYLARTMPCHYCKDYKIFNWRAELEENHLLKIIQDAGHSVRSLKSIAVHARDKAGLVKEIIIHDGHKAVKILGKNFYSLLSQVKSFCYTIERAGSKFVIAGKGYGHHLGICQWGARKMIDHGFTYTKILEFYYPGIEFMKLSKASSI